MSKLLYLSEILDFAIARERESQELYARLAQQVADQELQQLFQRLVDEEQKHEAYYTEMRAVIKEEHTPGVHTGEDYSAYVRELIAAGRQIKPLAAEQLADVHAALDYAIAREKDSVLFYVAMKEYLEPEQRAKVEVIIHEEERHATILSEVKARL